MKIYLVRHGQSAANIDWDVNKKIADHAIPLTSVGRNQAREVGCFLKQLFYYPTRPQTIRLWYSPYQRARQTAQIIMEQCVGVVGDSREHLLLAEQQFGLFDGLSDQERSQIYPEIYNHYEKCKRFEGKLWPRMPLGESRFDVCMRVHQSFGTFHRDNDKHGINTIVIVAHGTVNRAFLQMWCHKPAEWMHKEPNPNNCSVRLIDQSCDLGYIFEGFPTTNERP